MKDRDQLKDERNSSDRLKDPLGIEHAPVPQDLGDIHASDSPEEVAARRERALGERDGETRGIGSDVNDDGFGATSVDMGYGGEGNAVKKTR